jgi:small conductance mechanosensitive channel
MDLSIAYLRFEELATASIRLLPSFMLGVLIFILFLLIAKGIKWLVQRINRYRQHRNLGMVLGRLAQWGVILVGLLIGVTVAFPSFTPANLISALGITGIAIGFAFRDIFENFLAGILILITEPFRVGDQIVYGKYEGTVENIETRATMLRTYDGRRIVIPNSELYKNSVTVNTAFDIRRMEYDFGIGYGDSIDRAKKIMMEALGGIEEVLRDPAPDILTVGLADSSVKIRVRWWIHPPRRADALDVTDKVISQIKHALMVNGIDLPFPTQHVLFHDQTEETDGDRARQREGWPAGKRDVPKPRGIADSIARLKPRE